METKHLPHILGEVPVSYSILMCGGHAAGFFQTYRLRDFPEHPAGPRAGAAGLDFLLAPFEIGHGLATPASSPSCARCYADPGPANLASVQACARAGFRALPGRRSEGFCCSPAPPRVFAQS